MKKYRLTAALICLLLFMVWVALTTTGTQEAVNVSLFMFACIYGSFWVCIGCNDNLARHQESVISEEVWWRAYGMITHGQGRCGIEAWFKSSEENSESCGEDVIYGMKNYAQTHYGNGDLGRVTITQAEPLVENKDYIKLSSLF